MFFINKVKKRRLYEEKASKRTTGKKLIAIENARGDYNLPIVHELPFIDMSEAIDFSEAFSKCESLTSLPMIDTSKMN